MTVSNITIENAKIAFKNFTGKEGQYNPPGIRNFCVFLDSSMADILKNDGWNIKFLKAREEGESDQAYIQVGVSFDHFPPKITMITSRGKTNLDADSVKILDWADIENVDLIIRPYNWSSRGKSGIKAYLKTMYITITEDEFEKKYRDVPDSAMNSIDEFED